MKFQVASVWLNLVGARADARIEGIDRLWRGGSTTLSATTRPSGGIAISRPTRGSGMSRSIAGIDLIYHGSHCTRWSTTWWRRRGPIPMRSGSNLKAGKKPGSDQSGDLIIGTAAGDLTMRRPRVYQDDGPGNRRSGGSPLPGQRWGPWERRNDGAGWRWPDHDPRLALVIDPGNRSYSTYLGGKGDRSGAIQGFQALPPLLLASLMLLRFGAFDLALGPTTPHS